MVVEPSANKNLDPLGRALIAYMNGDLSATLCMEYRDGRRDWLPVSVFFRKPADFFEDEQAALAACRGRILDVGAGSGLHTVHLQSRQFHVTAIDVSPEAVAVMKQRGVLDARCQDFFALQDETFDTILMLGRNVGIAGCLEGVNALLGHCRNLLRPDGQLLLNSVGAPPGSVNAYGRGEYPGELEFRLSYGDRVGSWMKWLHIDFETLAMYAGQGGWTVDRLAHTPVGGYAARLELHS